MSLFATLVLFALVVGHLGEQLAQGFRPFVLKEVLDAMLFSVAVLSIGYSNILYHVCLIGHYVRQMRHTPTPQETLEQRYLRPAPRVTVLVPAYKEERSVIWQTLLSAALAEYPEKHVVLLIDDPYAPTNAHDQAQLDMARRIPHEMFAQFVAARAPFVTEKATYEARLAMGTLDFPTEAQHLAGLYEKAADAIDAMGQHFAHQIIAAPLTFEHRFFLDRMIAQPANAHRARAAALRASPPTTIETITCHYARLAALFSGTFASFERKKYANLSHEANKAMNLNSYIALIGKGWKEVPTTQGLELQPIAFSEADIIIPAADYINTIDADSLMTQDYILRLVHLMEQPEHARIAVAQSPCSCIPGSAKPIERIAGACIDVQFHTHQGYAHWNASFWVGANAMLRRNALEEIKEIQNQDGKMVTIYIQDRTVIEDTESTIDLVDKGWQLYNDPTRMTFSSTPPDFGSLIVQRRRWANGGMIILPKLLAYAWRSRKDHHLAKEMFMRFSYLAMTTVVCVVTFLLFFYHFDQRFASPLLVYATLPMLALFARDMKVCGYGYLDALRACALNLMLFPVITAGVLKQFQQMMTGRKIPFGRTPKVPGRTAAPALYCALEFGLLAYFTGFALYEAYQGHWMRAAFGVLNIAFFLYALIRFIGIKNAWEDIAHLWKQGK